MTTHRTLSSSNPETPEALMDRFGQRIAARLSEGADALPHDISERLRVARLQALARHRQPALLVQRQPAVWVEGGGPVAVMGGGDGGRDRMDFWGRMVSIGLAMVLVAGLVVIPLLEGEERAEEVADVDAALLIDELPPEAYADPGFVQYLKTSAPAASQKIE